MTSRIFAALGVVISGACFGQNLLPNPSFEQGTLEPTGWILRYGDGQWEDFGHTGGRGVSLLGTGNCGNQWQNTNCPVQAGHPYAVRFWGASSNVTVNKTFAGFTVANREFRNLIGEWTPNSFVAVLPNNLTHPLFYIAQCETVGKLLYDDVEVLPALPLHILAGGHHLGVGESMTPGRYIFETRLADYSGNYARPLHQHTAAFHSDRWVFADGAFVTYHHSLDDLAITNALLRATFKYYLGGELVIEVSTNGTSWVEAIRGNPASVGYVSTVIQTNVPASLLPSTELYVRLRATGTFWLEKYRLEADVPGHNVDADGQTLFFEQQTPGLDVLPIGISDSLNGYVLSLALHNPGAIPRNIGIQGSVQGASGTRYWGADEEVAPFSTNVVNLVLPTAGPGDNTLFVEIVDLSTDAILFRGSAILFVPANRDNSFGYMIPDSGDLPVWWTEATYKVTRERPLPVTTNSTIQIAGARNEYEPFQLVLRPPGSLSNLTVSITDFTSLSGTNPATISSTNVEFCLVEYVPVTIPTDPSSLTGNYPDPLIPMTGPVHIPNQGNQPLWTTVFIPKNVPAGDYQATISITSDTTTNQVPVSLRVYDFTLSDVTHTRTAFGAHLDENWYKPQTSEQRRQIWDYHMENFRKHRVSTYRPALFAPVAIAVTNDVFYHDFTNYDAALKKYIDEYKFNSFMPMDVPWWGGPYNPNGYPDSYWRLFERRIGPVISHLREKGWFDEAYLYSFDEPQPHQLPSVVEGTRKLIQHAPGLKRLVTALPRPELYGHVDIWVPFLTYLEPIKSQERQAVGDEAWWYVATGPRAPWPNNFIDHPAIEHRIRIWLAESMGVTGDLYWTTTWYVGSNGLPSNPWENAMSYHGNGSHLGNGDGVMLYPPTRTLPTGPVIAPPINSLRWELMRESLEDGEYFWLLKQYLRKVEAQHGSGHPAVQQGQAAYAAAMALVPSRTTFDREPLNLYAARHQMALAIEALDDGAPFLVSDPVPRAAHSEETVLLQSEFLAWPPPSYQWFLNGSAILTATNTTLTLSNLSPALTGNYMVVASNIMGAATSAVAKIIGYWENAPSILLQPEGLARGVGDSAVLMVTAVSTNPMNYTWLFNGEALFGPTNFALVLPKLGFGHEGDFSVIISNSVGVVTSAVAPVVISGTNQSLISRGSPWRWHDAGQDLSTAWRATEYDDSNWKLNWAQFGYGDGDEHTTVSYGTSPTNRNPTTYFRHGFYFDAESIPPALDGSILRDDGVVVYLNGVEVFRNNLPTGAVSYATWALNDVSGANENAFLNFPVPGSLLVTGLNVVAVEIHQFTNNSDDLSFDFALGINPNPQPPQILQHPAGLARRAGEDATFSVTAASGIPMAYQWWFNQSPVSGGTNANLVLLSLGTNQAGNYQVVVTNQAGAVTSAPAALLVLDRLAMFGHWLTNGSGFLLELPGTNVPCTVLFSTNLTTWVELVSFPSLPGPTNFIDSAATNSPHRFYQFRVD